MADTPETGSTLDGDFKRVYVDSTKDVIPSWAKLQKSIKFDSVNKIGEDYRINLLLKYAQGFTYNGGANYGTAFTLNDAIAGAAKQASVKGCEILMKEVIAYGLISRTADGSAAFDKAVDLIVRSMIESHSLRLEAMTLYGGGSLGTVSSVAGSYTAATAVLTTATWAPGLWTGSEGMQLDAYDSTLTTKRNTNGPITLSSVDTTNLTLNLVYAAGADFSAVVATDVFVPVGAKGNWADGIDTVVTTAAAGGTIFGLSATTYGMLRASTYGAGSAALTFAKLASAAAKPVVRGGMNDMTTYVSPYTWIDMMNNEASLRRYSGELRGEFVNGADRIQFYSVNGVLSVEPHGMVKAGEAFMINPSDWRRIGSAEPTFEQPGRGPTGNPYFVTEEPTKAGYSIRRWSDTGLICTAPARQLKITGITNTTTVG